MRRRAAQAAAAASAASALSARALRPLLFVVVSLFLVLPMLIYNFATLDEAQIRRWTESVHGATAGMRGAMVRHDAHDHDDDDLAIAALPASLRSCATISRTNLSSSEAVDALRHACFTPDTTPSAVAADIVHFVYLPVHMVPLLPGELRPPAENFTMAQFAAVHAVRKFVKPTLMVLHYPATEPRAYWYTQCQRYLSLHRVLFPPLPSSTPSSLSVYQRRDVMQLVIALRALRLQGGVAFTDFNTLVLRPTRLLRQLPLVAGRSHGKTFAISPSMLSASAGNAHVAFLESKLLAMLEQDNHRLRETPLDQLLGELLLESMAKTSGDALPNIVLTAPTVLESLHDVHVHELVQSTPTDTTMRLRESVAIHVPTSQRLSTSSYASLTALTQSKLADFDALAEEPSLLSALLRFAILLNTTRELDGVL